MKKGIVAEPDQNLYRSTVALAQAVVPTSDITYALTGEELLRKVRDDNYSLVMVACCVDGQQDGPDVVREIRQYDGTVPIYIFSVELGSVEMETRRRAMEAGATGYLNHLKDATEFESLFKKYLE